MKINKICITLLIVSGFIGCANNTKQLNITNKNNYIEYNNSNHVIGNPKKAIKKIVYIETINNKPTVKIIFNIDKLPYKKQFNLCKNIKNINCKGNIFVTKFNNHLLASVKIKLLKGYKTIKINNKNEIMTSFEKFQTTTTALPIKQIIENNVTKTLVIKILK